GLGGGAACVASVDAPVIARATNHAPSPGTLLGQGLLVLLMFSTGARPSSAHTSVSDTDTTASSPARGHDTLTPLDRPDIAGSGKVSRSGNLWLKTTNIGVVGNPYPALSSDPSAQWPGPSGVEYLFFAGLWVAARNPTASDPTLAHRVSQNTEWRPPSLAPEDHIYEAHAGEPNGFQLVDDDAD